MPSYYNGYYPTQPSVFPTQMNVGPTQANALAQGQAQVQNGGFVSIPNEDIARTYPVAPGNCVTFKVEGKPIVLEKSMGFSQFEAPKIDRYRLVKEEPEEASNLPQIDDFDVKGINTTIDGIKSEIEAIWSEIEDIKNVSSKKASPRRKDDGGSD